MISRGRGGTRFRRAGRSGYFADSEGNRRELAWAPGMEFDPASGGVTRFGD